MRTWPVTGISSSFGRELTQQLFERGDRVVGAAEELSDDQIDATIATNLTASIQLFRGVIPHMRAAGGGPRLRATPHSWHAHHRDRRS